MSINFYWLNLEFAETWSIFDWFWFDFDLKFWILPLAGLEPHTPLRLSTSFCFRWLRGRMLELFMRVFSFWETLELYAVLS